MHENWREPGTGWQERGTEQMESGWESGEEWREGPPGRGLAIGLLLSAALWLMLAGLFWLGECVLRGAC